MEFESAVSIPVAIGAGLTQAAFRAAQDVRRSGDLARAQQWIDHLAASARAADADYRALVAELSASRQREALLQVQVDAADQEALELSLEIRRLRGGGHRGSVATH